MKVLLFGATGMVGQGVLRECLVAADVSAVVAVGRSRVDSAHAKLVQFVKADPGDLADIAPELRDVDACFFCLGVSSAGMNEADYSRLTFELTMKVATALAGVRPEQTFIYVSGAGTDSSEHGRSMWARVKGRTENGLRALPFARVALFRPGVIQPLHGIVSKTPSYRVLYALMAPFLGLAHRLWPNRVLTTEGIGLAMLNTVRQGAAGIFEAPAIAALARG